MYFDSVRMDGNGENSILKTESILIFIDIVIVH